MAELKPKRGFVDLDHWDVIGEDSVVQPIIWDDGSDDGSDVCVLLIPDPDRDPTPEEIEALAEALYATTAPGALDGPFAATLREVVRAAWKLGARVPHA